MPKLSETDRGGGVSYSGGLWLPVWKLIFTAAEELRRRRVEGCPNNEKPTGT